VLSEVDGEYPYAVCTANAAIANLCEGAGFTLEAWLRPEVLNRRQLIFQCGYDPPGPGTPAGYRCYINETGYPVVEMLGVGSVVSSVAWPVDGLGAPKRCWIGFQWDGAKACIRIVSDDGLTNAWGALDETLAAGTGPAPTYCYLWALGGTIDDWPLTGSIEYIRLWQGSAINLATRGRQRYLRPERPWVQVDLMLNYYLGGQTRWYWDHLDWTVPDVRWETVDLPEEAGVHAHGTDADIGLLISDAQQILNYTNYSDHESWAWKTAAIITGPQDCVKQAARSGLASAPGIDGLYKGLALQPDRGVEGIPPGRCVLPGWNTALEASAPGYPAYANEGCRLLDINGEGTVNQGAMAETPQVTQPQALALAILDNVYTLARVRFSSISLPLFWRSYFGDGDSIFYGSEFMGPDDKYYPSDGIVGGAWDWLDFEIQIRMNGHEQLVVGPGEFGATPLQLGWVVAHTGEWPEYYTLAYGTGYESWPDYSVGLNLSPLVVDDQSLGVLIWYQYPEGNEMHQYGVMSLPLDAKEAYVELLVPAGGGEIPEDDMPVVWRRGVAMPYVFDAWVASGGGERLIGHSFAAGIAYRWKDAPGDSWTGGTTTATPAEIASSGKYALNLTAAEMDHLVVQVLDPFDFAVDGAFAVMAEILLVENPLDEIATAPPVELSYYALLLEALNAGMGTNPTKITLQQADETPITGAHVWMTITDEPNHTVEEIIGASLETTDDAGGIILWTDLAAGTGVHLWAQCPGYAFAYATDAEVGKDALVEGTSVSVTGLDDSLDDLIDLLRIRVNDVDQGNHLSSELAKAINLAYRETVVLAKTHRLGQGIELVQGTHTYDAAEIFEVIEIPGLDRVHLGDLGVSLAAWDTAAQDVPKKWMPVMGSWFRVYPTPAASPDGITVYGYARPEPLRSGTDHPIALPDAFSIQVMLDRAEAEVRKWRAYVPGNGAMVVMLMESWRGWCLKTAEACGG